MEAREEQLVDAVRNLQQELKSLRHHRNCNSLMGEFGKTIG